MGGIPVHWPPSTHEGNSNQHLQAGISCSMQPCSASHGGEALSAVPTAPILAQPDSHSSETGGQVLPWPLTLSGHWHNPEQKRSSRELCWEPPAATKASSKWVTGSQEWSGSTQRSSCVCQIFLLWMYPFTFEEKRFRFGGKKAVLLFGCFMRNFSCKIWRIQKV